jgi:DNA polymerase-3 subunit delta'
VIVGQDRAIEQFVNAWASRKLHHAWLLAGPKGVGKATFARAAARRVLAEAAGPPFDLPPIETDGEHPIVRLVEARSHPDFRWLERIENPKAKTPGTLYRNITVDQVRELGEFLILSAALSSWRVVVIDTIDELEREGANALLKMLEEPPANTIFLLVSHAPGRLLPTIRSRCRRLDFQSLDDEAMTSVLAKALPEQKEFERKRIVAAAGGSAGRALALAELNLVSLEEKAIGILREGDPTNGRRSDLALELGKRGSADRYAAFLDLLPSIIARETRSLSGGPRQRAIEAYAKTRELVATAPRLSLDPASTVFQLGGILASVADPLP